MANVEKFPIIGRTIVDIDRTENERLDFKFSDGEVWSMYHNQDCCENVFIEDIDNDLSVLLDLPLTIAECVSSNDGDRQFAGRDDFDESYTWTFYRLATEKGFVVIRWYGTSNGYYSEGVDFEQTKIAEPPTPVVDLPAILRMFKQDTEIN